MNTEKETKYSKKNSFFKLELLLLTSILRKDSYGHEMAQTIKEQTEGLFDIKEGVMYPILANLVEKGYVSKYEIMTEAKRRRVYYHIEQNGKKYLTALKNEFRQGVSLVEKYISMEDKRDG